MQCIVNDPVAHVVQMISGFSLQWKNRCIDVVRECVGVGHQIPTVLNAESKESDMRQSKKDYRA